MKTHIEHQIIEHGSKPMFVVVPYEEYLALIDRTDDEVAIPDEVVRKLVMEEKSLVCAWREYKKMSQSEVAQKMGITHPAYSQMERRGRAPSEENPGKDRSRPGGVTGTPYRGLSTVQRRDMARATNL